MKVRLLLLLLGCSVGKGIVAQQRLPVINSSSASVTIRDGDQLRRDYWTLTPSAKPDVYEANRTRRTKRVSFITDLDSISFVLKPGQAHDFVILLNDTDSCFTRMRSAIMDPGGQVKEPWRSDTIPFILSAQNNVLVPTVLNNTDTLLMMFHSAYRGVSVIRGSLDRAKSVHIDGTTVSRAWGGSAEEGVSRENAISIGNQYWDGLEIAIDALSGKGSDGKFGYDLFADQVVELNYDRGVMVVHNRLPKRMKSYAKWPIHYESGSFFVEGAVTIEDRVYPERFMFHTGYGGQFILGTGFMDRYGLYGKLDTASVEELKDSFGNTIKNLTIEVPALRIGRIRSSHVRGNLMDPSSRFEASVLGNGFLKQFNVIIDLRNDVIYLKKRSISSKHN